MATASTNTKARTSRSGERIVGQGERAGTRALEKTAAKVISKQIPVMSQEAG